jgi:hypothetical protein
MLQAQPLVPAAVTDGAALDGAKTPGAGDLLSRAMFLYSLAPPALRKGNLTALWNDALSRSGMVAAGAENNVADSLAIAENRSKSGVAVTTVMVSNDNGRKAQAVPLHIVWNSAQDRLLIVGEGKLPARVTAAFSHSRVQYVDRADADAQQKTATALTMVLGAPDEKLADRLKTAFLMRNMLDSLPDQEQAGLADLLVRRDVRCFLPRYAVKPAVR